LAGVLQGGVAVVGGSVGVGQVDEHPGAGAVERGGQPGQGVGQLVDGFRFAEASEGMSAPAVEVAVAEEEEGQTVVGWVGG
jgi:hypothetical protein